MGEAIEMVLASSEKQDSAMEAGIPTLEQAKEIERQNALPISSFYAAPVGAGAAAGELIRSERVSEYDIPSGITAYRILYGSTGSGGEQVATSAAVLLPAHTPPPGGWPIIAWAHGTSGVARQCAPSAMKNLYYGSVLSDMVQAGFAIIATDYHGLGTDGRHRYMDRIAQANDIINSIPAARRARAEIGGNWVVSGHSQGGLAAWTVAERQAEILDPTYKGAVAVAPATHLPRLLDHPEEAQGAGYYFAWHAFAIETRYPDFKPEEMLSEIGLREYENVTSAGCWLYGLSTYAGVDDVAMLRPGWNNNKWVRRFYSENTGGTAPARGAILVVAGEGDTAVPIAGIRDAVEKGLRNGQSISLKVYPGLDHDPAMMETLQDQIEWIRARLSSDDDTRL